MKLFPAIGFIAALAVFCFITCVLFHFNCRVGARPGSETFLLGGGAAKVGVVRTEDATHVSAWNLVRRPKGGCTRHRGNGDVGDQDLRDPPSGVNMCD